VRSWAAAARRCGIRSLDAKTEYCSPQIERSEKAPGRTGAFFLCTIAERMTTRACVWGIVAGAAMMAAGAAAIGAASDPITTKHLVVAASTVPAALGPGARVSLVLDISPKPTMHVYAPGQKDFIPVSLTLDANDAFKAAAARFPAAETLVVKELGETQLVYRKPFRIVQDVTIAKRIPGSQDRAGNSAMTVTGTLKYQACDDSICYAPVSVPVKWTLAPQDGPAVLKKP
jgi:DsbC/DsbD-like thiol-disulfide interchange protein